MLVTHGILATEAPNLPVSKAGVLTLSVGPAWYQAGETQTIMLVPDFANTYVADKARHVLTSGELFLGLQNPLGKYFLVQLGVAAAIDDPLYLSGAIWEFADPAFDNFNYTYKLNYWRAALKAKLASIAINPFIQPYLLGSIGIGFTEANQFVTTTNLFQAIPPPSFQNHQSIAATYTVGAGIQATFNAHWQVGVGYEFASLGRNRLERAFGQTLNTGLALNHVYTSQLQFSVSYFI